MPLTNPSISVDISLYPLSHEYKQAILQFIDQLSRVEGLELLRNPMSTQVFGPFALVWETLGRLLPESFGAEHTSVVVLKIVSIDVSS